ncbi:hypothetical protein SEA_KAHVE_25 [Mycobacterium phage Kahve]|uniref:Tail assembly chaperone n=1 Tax=Mycobacterium phage Kahve TaxID=2250360 RepID=A0A2Z5H6V7_9CAUD|nr:hypothetical protein SEA_KAHVE_25 [Mycobacterium phage Kahve]AYQ98700.1 hypothetical protein SEA_SCHADENFREUDE_25 [Mycobacterium phage Schadenfreude]
MATFNADGKTVTDEQLSPPAEYLPDLTDSEREADYQAEQARIEAAIADAAAADDDDELPEVEVLTPPAGLATTDEQPGTEVATFERFNVEEVESWTYDKLEFKGDLLGIRLPTKAALAGFSLASSKYVSLGVKNDLTGLFIARHLSPESYGRVFSRLMDPDDVDYDVDAVGELFNAIVTAAVESDAE